MDLRLIPKSTEAKNISDEPIIFFLAFKMINNKPRITDTNSAYNQGGIFKLFGLTTELDDWLYEKAKKLIQNYKNINENSDNNKNIIYKVLRRLPNIDNRLDYHMKNILDYYPPNKIKQYGGLNWFIETLIYNIWLDDISEIFEIYDETQDIIEVPITSDEIDMIKNFIRTKFKDKIENTYNKFIS
jgi:hypothetical protein